MQVAEKQFLIYPEFVLVDCNAFIIKTRTINHPTMSVGQYTRKEEKGISVVFGTAEMNLVFCIGRRAVGNKTLLLFTCFCGSRIWNFHKLIAVVLQIAIAKATTTTL